MTLRQRDRFGCLSDEAIEAFSAKILSEKRICRTTLNSVLRRARTFEAVFGKAFYEFDIPEILKMYTDVNSISVRSLQNMNLFLKEANDFFSPEKPNSFELITKDLLAECVNPEKRSSLTISKKELYDMTGCLSNYTDKAIVLLLFLGAGGRKLREISFCTKENLNCEKSLIAFDTGKRLYLSKEELYILQKALCEDELCSFDTSVPATPVISLGIYKMRYNTMSSNSNPENTGDAERRYRFLQRRLALISCYLEIPLTPCALQTSGLLWNLGERISCDGIPFRKFVRTDSARALAARYDIKSRFVPQILTDKFLKYFPEQ